MEHTRHISTSFLDCTSLGNIQGTPTLPSYTVQVLGTYKAHLLFLDYRAHLVSFIAIKNYNNFTLYKTNAMQHYKVVLSV